MDIKIDKKDENLPIFRQIEQQITEKIGSGELRSGDRLPTERELSQATNISIGTVKRAYLELGSKGILERIRGNGTFITQLNDPTRLEVQLRMSNIVDSMLDELSYMRLSYKETQSLINSKIQWRRQMTSNLCIAIVDCNMETLGLISGQLCKISDVDVSELLLYDLEKTPQRLTYGYDLILTPKTHYLQVVEMAPTVADRIIKVAIEPSARVQYELARIRDYMSVGIWCMSQEFANAVYKHISLLGRKMLQVDYRLDSEPGEITQFLRGKDVLVLPYDYFGRENGEEFSRVEQFQKDGGQVVFFEYHIDHGSLIHVNYELDHCRRRKLKKPKVL